MEDTESPGGWLERHYPGGVDQYLNELESYLSVLADWQQAQLEQEDVRRLLWLARQGLPEPNSAPGPRSRLREPEQGGESPGVAEDWKEHGELCHAVLQNLAKYIGLGELAPPHEVEQAVILALRSNDETIKRLRASDSDDLSEEFLEEMRGEMHDDGWLDAKEEADEG